jgi:outer membrane lipoprotein-sorting protein
MKRAVQRFAAIAAVCCASPLLPAGPTHPQPASTPQPAAESLVQSYNARDFGSPGWRRIYLELKAHSEVTRTFSILHLWSQSPHEVRSLVHLEAPAGLKGTNYLLLESPRLTRGMELFLYLPSGQRRVLNVKPGRFDEGLLGSDFTYRDLLWRIPTEGYRLRLASRTRMLNREVWGVDAEPTKPETAETSSWSRIRYYLGQNPPLLLGADFFRGEAAQPGKRLRTESLAQRDGVWTPTRLVMRLNGGRSSVLSLRETAFGSGPFDPNLFVPDLLATATERLPSAGVGRSAARSGPAAKER